MISLTFLGAARTVTGSKYLLDTGKAKVLIDAGLFQIGSMSAHADSSEILRWLDGFTRPPRMTFLVHGEIPAMQALDAAIRTKLGRTMRMPALGEVVTLES